MKLLLTFLILFFSANLFAQVKIGTPAGAPLPSAVLELADINRGFLPPRLTVLQRDNIGSPANGLIIYNTDANQLNIYQQNAWKALSTDSAQWKFDAVGKKVDFVKPYQVGDTIFYDTLRHKFLFADKMTYKNSQGTDYSPFVYGGKYTFKTTASKSADSISSSKSSLAVFYEIDNASDQFTSGYSGIWGTTTINPTALQKDYAYGINYTTIHAGADTCYQLTGISNVTYNNGIGETDEIYGILNQTTMGTYSTGNIGSVYGMYNLLTRSAPATGRITDNLYGYLGLTSNSITSRVNGTAYGIFLSSVSGAVNGNYSIYTNLGINRFGDSVLVGGGIRPRAFVDINNPTSMIIPTGAIAQRPVSGVKGMIRYNSDNGGLVEAYDGTTWTGTIRTTQIIDIPLISPGAGYTQSFTVTGAVVGSSVTISPTNALDNGLIISWARVSAADTVEVRFNLLYGTAIDPTAQNFYVRIIR